MKFYFPLALLVLDAVLGFGLVVPQIVSFTRSVNRFEARRDELTVPGGPKSATPAASRIISLIAGLRTMVVPEKTELALINDFEALAARAGVKIDIRLTPPPSGTPGTYYERLLGVDISLEGDPRAVGSFIEEVERRDLVLGVKTFGVTAASNLTGGAVSATLSGVVSWPEH